MNIKISKRSKTGYYAIQWSDNGKPTLWVRGPSEPRTLNAAIGLLMRLANLDDFTWKIIPNAN